MEALRRSVGQTQHTKSGKKVRKPSSEQKEMLMPIEGKRTAKESAAKKPAKPQRKSA
jgi:DNA end-binding protein Ku